jgi:hypothetical protein
MPANPFLFPAKHTNGTDSVPTKPMNAQPMKDNKDPVKGGSVGSWLDDKRSKPNYLN